MTTFSISRCARGLRAPNTVNGTRAIRRYTDRIEIRHDISRFSTTPYMLNKVGIPATPPPQHPKPFSLRPYMELARVDRPIGSWLLFMPCTWSITLASQFAGAPISTWLTNLALFGAGSFIMRSAGCTINDMWDAKIDAQVERTKTRPIASGEVSYPQATVFLGLQLAAGLAILVNLNTYSIVLGCAALIPVTIYPLMKRYTNWPQIGMGLSFTWGSMLGWSAIAGSCYWPAVLPLYASTTVWGIAYDTIYAHQDKIDDARTHVGSTAQVFGDHYTKPALVVFSAVWMALLAYAVHNASPLFPWLSDAELGELTWDQYIDLTLATGHPFFCMAWLATAAHVAWQIRTVNLNNPRDCFKKFASNRTVGLIIFTGLAADYLYEQKYAPYKHQRSASRAAPHA
ncbi:4-hydroxybenzoate polyprenyltransferase [Malassezia yamatoensis]|uniref:4-hydroxybenzoate polyprenyltransferase, mitochondrial n=1 Tax=Malassezia yamatoensis TaxID=253288 RepID=A0AAJ6CJR5_9BASI|nr:4-hydroxybenzoate polyprenyltransferase [Malassezia yamatoensis]